MTLGTDLTYEVGRQSLQPRVTESGLFFKTPLQISGYQNQTLRVLVFTDSNTFIGAAEAIPRYENSEWEEFPIFVPYSKLTDMTPETGYSVYVVSPDDPDHYASSARYSRSNILQPDIVWQWSRYEDDAVLASGQIGMRLTLALRLRGHKDENIQAYLLVRDAGESDFGSDVGGPIKLSMYPLASPYEDSSFSKLEFEIPYSAMSALPPVWRVSITPSLMIDGTLYPGNIHFSTWAGGSLDKVRTIVNAAIENDDREIRALQQQIDRLNRELGR